MTTTELRHVTVTLGFLGNSWASLCDWARSLQQQSLCDCRYF